MRLNQFLARYTDMSRRVADQAIAEGRVEVNGVLARMGDTVIESDVVSLDGDEIKRESKTTTIILNKPAEYVCSRKGQGSKTVFELLPEELQKLQTVGRLDKDSSGLLLLTNDGELANELTHPRYLKVKKYLVTLNKPLEPSHHQKITELGVKLDDGLSRFGLTLIRRDGRVWEVTMKEGRNRQIRRTFSALGYRVTMLHRTAFGPYILNDLQMGEYSVVI